MDGDWVFFWGEGGVEKIMSFLIFLVPFYIFESTTKSLEFIRTDKLDIWVSELKFGLSVNSHILCDLQTPHEG